MKLFKSFLSKAIKPRESTANEFKASSCKCVQQNLDLSELTWIDTTPYTRLMENSKARNKETLRVILKSKDQRDLFEDF